MDVKQNRMDDFSDNHFLAKKSHKFSRFLNALYEAEEYAADLNCSSWDFAIQLADAQAMNVQVNDLRWMVRKGWIRHASHVVSDTASQCYEDDSGRFRISGDSCFVIGQAGVAAMEHFHAPGENPDQPAFSVAASQTSDGIKPVWNADRHELSLTGRIVKRYRWPATNQETILMTFQDDGWPSRIDDPLPRVDNLEPKRRLSDTIKCLNRNQCENLVRFRGDGTGEGVLWDVHSVR